MNTVDAIIFNTIYSAAPILLCVLGGIYAYKANVLNIALEGMMLMGAFSAALFVHLTGSVFVGILMALILNSVLGLIFSFFSISKKGNCIIVGLAINLFVSAIAAFALKSLSMATIDLGTITEKMRFTIPFLKDIPIIGAIFGRQSYITWISFILIGVMYVLMYKTKFGVYVRVAGENEEAARAVGIRTTLIKYVAILIGGLCCALAGANLALDQVGGYTNDMTASRGFIAIAAIYCGKGKPGLSAIYAVLFGFAQALAVYFQISAGSAALLIKTIPYILIVIVLALYSVSQLKNNRMRGLLS